jgi:hypothetical protein
LWDGRSYRNSDDVRLDHYYDEYYYDYYYHFYDVLMMFYDV